MNQGLKVLVYPVQDIAKARAFFTQFLGIEPYVDAAYYVGYKMGDLEIGLDPSGQHKGLTGPFSFWNVTDIRKTLQSLVDGGAQILQEPHDVGGGMLVALVKDVDNNLIGLRE